jgi:hypothetical protein
MGHRSSSRQKVYGRRLVLTGALKRTAVSVKEPDRFSSSQDMKAGPKNGTRKQHSERTKSESKPGSY